LDNNFTFKGELKLTVNRDNKWLCHKINNGYILYKGDLLSWGLRLDDLAIFFNDSTIDNSSITEYISNIRGNFSLIVNTSYRTIVAVDCIRSNPLYYLLNDGLLTVTDDIFFLQKEIGRKLSISDSSKLQILMSGYTLFEDTLYTEVKSFIPGQVLLYHRNDISAHNTNDYQTWFNSESSQFESLDFLRSNFNDVILEVMSETISSLNNRQVVIPLSGGYDSRIIASILRHYNYNNVVCFTYGMNDNFEAISAKKLANDLGYKWFFIDLNIKDQSRFYQSDDFSVYLEYADTIDSVSYYQGLYAVKYLKEKKLIDDDAIFINGNSGDFITGGHISKLYKYCNKSYFCKNIFDIIIDKYYSLWGHMKTSENVNSITSKIENNYKHLKDSYNTDIKICDFAYYYEFINRQSKYVIQGQKTFEYYGYDWRMPLWDSKMIVFWSTVPNNYKNKQFLYKSTIKRYNYSNAWNESHQINKYKISSPIVGFTRRFFKLIVVILTGGNYKIWDKVDRVFFLYFYDITRMLCSVPYWKVVISFFKGPRHNVSFDVEKYISHHEKYK
jgi:asparagine synthase (glutamine-hydrolysing)